MTNILISKPIFGKKIKRLADAFRVDLSKDTISVYYDKLKYCSEKNFLTAVEYLIDSEDWFPSIHKLKDSITPTMQDQYDAQSSIEDLLS